MDRPAPHPAGFYSEAECKLEDLIALCGDASEAAALHFAESIEKRIPIYNAASLGNALGSVEGRRNLMAEWAQVLRDGAGVLVIRQACPDTASIDRVTDVFNTLIENEKAAKGGGGDHFAAAGSNDRLWNALQKLAETSARDFVAYHASPAIDAVCEAWLGPGYQMTAQVNLVHPGGRAQQAHRDYHLGFQTAEQAATYPAHVHQLSPVMTLQGAVAHCDMPVISGPTKLLPFSQRYRPGYVAWRRADFRDWFEHHQVQLPLAQGDALFFNPALFHAAGDNDSDDIQRMANLLQVSSPFGRAMESVDRARLAKLIYPALLERMQAATDKLDTHAVDAVIAAAAEGYAFPTNLDTDPPLGGLAPKTQQQLMRESLLSGLDADAFNQALDAQEARRCA